MWVITVWTENRICMYEFETKTEADKTFKEVKGCKILSEIVYSGEAVLSSI